jgi:hypothetical protein
MTVRVSAKLFQKKPTAFTTNKKKTIQATFWMWFVGTSELDRPNILA